MLQFKLGQFFKCKNVIEMTTFGESYNSGELSLSPKFYAQFLDL